MVGEKKKKKLQGYLFIFNILLLIKIKCIDSRDVRDTGKIGLLCSFRRPHA